MLWSDQTVVEAEIEEKEMVLCDLMVMLGFDLVKVGA